MKKRIRLYSAGFVLGLLFFPDCALWGQQKVTTTATSVAMNTPQFLWFNTDNALRIGTVSSSTPWSSGNIGDYSFAFGSNAMAADYGFAFGDNAQAAATAFAFGPNSLAGYSGIAIGHDAIASGSGIAIGPWSYAADGSLQLGGSGAATGYGAISLGESFATAPWAFSAVYCGAAYGYASIGIGVESWAEGDYSVSLGAGAYAKAWGGIALGFGNVAKKRDGSAIAPSNPSSLDPIFEVARPDPALELYPGERGPYNALTIYRDGQAHFIGVVRVPGGGDIPMGTYTAKPSGVVYP
jgi:hypothetical protein